MHIPPFDNGNNAIIDIDDARVPLNYFNIVKLRKGQAFEYMVPGYETCIVPATGTVDIEVEGLSYRAIGNRTLDVWDGEPEGVYVPTAEPKLRWWQPATPPRFLLPVPATTKHSSPSPCAPTKSTWSNTARTTPRPIARSSTFWEPDTMIRVGRLLVSELYHCWPGWLVRFSAPQTRHGPDPRRIPPRRDLQFPFSSGQGLRHAAGAARGRARSGDAYHIVDGSTIISRKGLSPLRRRTRDTRCTTSPSWAACRSARWCSISSPSTPGRSRPFPASKT